MYLSCDCVVYSFIYLLSLADNKVNKVVLRGCSCGCQITISNGKPNNY